MLITSLEVELNFLINCHIMINSMKSIKGRNCLIIHVSSKEGFIPQHLSARHSKLRFKTENAFSKADSDLFQMCLQFDRSPKVCR